MQGEHSKQSSFFGMISEELILADHLLGRLSAGGDFGVVRQLVRGQMFGYPHNQERANRMSPACGGTQGDC